MTRNRVTEAIEAWRALRDGQRLDVLQTLEQQRAEWVRLGELTVDVDAALALLRAAAEPEACKVCEGRGTVEWSSTTAKAGQLDPCYACKGERWVACDIKG